MDELKQKLAKLQGLNLTDTNNLDEWYKVELTYTSNAIEGNTLTRAETAIVVDKGITVEGKSVREHLEAINHAKAWNFAKELIKKKTVDESEMLEIHRLILTGIDDTNAGKYRTVPVRIAGSTVIMPNPLRVPELMNEFWVWMKKDEVDPVSKAIEAHYKFVSIHPFVDGNGRTARILMNIILGISGYPPAIIGKEDRLKYITSLEKAQLGGSKADFEKLMMVAINKSIDICLETYGGKKSEVGDLLKIGELAKLVDESVVTIRHWTKEGLLLVKSHTKGGYQLYGKEMIERVLEIRRLQREKRLRLWEIKSQISI